MPEKQEIDHAGAEFVHIGSVKKVYTPSTRRIRAELGLDLGYTFDKDGNLVKVEKVEAENEQL